MRYPKRIRWSHVRRLYEMVEPSLKAAPLKLSSPNRGKVLVIAPHIDDDVIGAGGSIRKHVTSGDPVTVLYLSDCTEERRREAQESAEVIGVEDLRFFEYSSKTLLEQRDLSERIDDIIKEVRPDIVYVPSLFDRHNDHLAVNHLLMALAGEKGYHMTVCGYEVWTTLVPNLIVDISDTVEKKREALACYRSQLSSNNWLEAAISLNRYRGVSSGAGMYAEGFMRYSMREYSALWKRVYAR
ncbi:MAG TPA: PIG-L deacetylase family protein [Thermodesulfovibrionales bacterium]|nr:PIG-L deacetylase family protein [Thermodesulfovibrionales bacterium]